MLVRDRQVITNTVMQNNLTSTQVYEISKQGNLLLGLTYGLFATFAEAQQARVQLPERLLKQGAFAKSLDKIQQQIQANN
jgi:DamX protein